MTQSTGEPAVPPTTGAPAPAVPTLPGPRPEGGGGEPGTEIANPEAKRYADEAAEWRTKFRSMEKEFEKLRASTLSESEKALAEAKAAGASEYQAKWRQAVLDNAALTILAEKRVSAVELALRSLDTSDVDVDDSGRVDSVALSRKVDELVARYPMLLADVGPGIGPISGADQRRVQSGQIAKPGDNDREALNKLARYALGSGD